VRLIIGPEPVRVIPPPTAKPILQNLGPGLLYYDTDDSISADTSIRMPVGSVYEFAESFTRSGSGLWLVADTADTDVRIVPAPLNRPYGSG
jgi:hypothetical protein